MKNNTKKHIFFVDDEPRVRKVVDKTLKRLGTKVSCFASARDCLEQLRSQTCDLLITDVKMPEMSGIELLTEAKRFVPWLPVLLVTGYGDIPMAVKALKMGALNFLEKPLEMQSFLSAVESALDGTAAFDPPVGKKLTRTEMRVLRLILDGKSNKEIARLLHRAMRTIEWHRDNIMCKLGVNNTIELVKQAAVMNLVKLPTNE